MLIDLITVFGNSLRHLHNHVSEKLKRKLGKVLILEAQNMSCHMMDILFVAQVERLPWILRLFGVPGIRNLGLGLGLALALVYS